MKMETQILKTMDYSKFCLLSFNRNITENRNLERSMMQYGFIDDYPIVVVKNGDGKLKIKSGHHRFYYARKLGLPVYYKISQSAISIYELEAGTKPWVLQDYLDANVRQEKQDYILLKTYHERSGIPLTCCISMVAGESAGSSNKQIPFKEGTYRVGDLTHARLVADLISFLQNRCNVSFALNSNFVAALSKVLWVPEFSIERFKKKSCSHSYLFEKKRSFADYVDLIEAVYNRQSKSKDPIAFLAEKVAKERSKICFSGKCHSK
jgi:hypothetical protein